MADSLAVAGLCKRYGDDFSLHDVSFRVEQGCVVGLVGANGAGKTTIIKAVLGLIAADAGSVHMLGEPFGLRAEGAACKQVKERIGIVFDTCPYAGHLRVRAIGSIMAAAYPSWDAEVFSGYLDRFGLAPGRRVKDLSRGMGMKLQIACALSHDCALLILDEATAGLDPLAREEVLDILRVYLARDDRRSVLMSSHITSDLERIADRVVCIDDGRVAFDLDADAIVDLAGVARCRADEFEAVLKSGLCSTDGSTRFVRNACGIDVLAPDRVSFMRRFPSIACDRVSIDEYMQIVLKGESR